VSSLDEIQLAKQAIKGDEHAQIQLLQIYEGAMYKVAFSYMRNEHDAYDALSKITGILKNLACSNCDQHLPSNEAKTKEHCNYRESP